MTTTVADQPPLGSVEQFERAMRRFDPRAGNLYPFAIGMIEAVVTDLHTGDELKVSQVRNALIALGRVSGRPSAPKPIGYCANCVERCEGQHGPCSDGVDGCIEETPGRKAQS